MSNQDSFYQNFQGFKHCSIFHFQGSCCCCSQRQRSVFYHIVFALSTTFLIFFLNLFRFALLFSAACYILPDVHAFVNNFLIFLFTLTLFFAGELYYIILPLVCQRFFQILSHFITKKELQTQKCIRSPFFTLFSLTKSHLKYE